MDVEQFTICLACITYCTAIFIKLITRSSRGSR